MCEAGIGNETALHQAEFLKGQGGQVRESCIVTAGEIKDKTREACQSTQVCESVTGNRAAVLKAKPLKGQANQVCEPCIGDTVDSSEPGFGNLKAGGKLNTLKGHGSQVFESGVGNAQSFKVSVYETQINKLVQVFTHFALTPCK
jgi:hypothetical protein